MELITDIPRLYTGLAEWAGCLIMLLICRRKVSNAALIAISMAAAVLQCGFLTATAGVEAGALWIAIMLLAVMFLFIFLCAGISLLGAVYCTAAAFLFAEFAASLEWQLYSWASKSAPLSMPASVILLAVVYTGVFAAFFFSFRHHLTEDYLESLPKEGEDDYDIPDVDE